MVAVGAKFELVTLAWCIPELAKAPSSGMKRELKLLNFRILEEHAPQLRTLHIEDMDASWPEDVAEILCVFPGRAAFNARLRELLFH